MKRYSILILMIYLFISCERDKNPLEPNFFDNKIIGTWKSNGETLSFFKDGTFLSYLILYSRLDELIPKPKLILHGHYDITENIIEFKNIIATYIDSTINGGSFFLNFREISFVNDSLVMTPVHILNLVEGSGDELWGNWTEILWGCNFKNHPLEILYSGRQKYTFIFEKDIQTVKYKFEYLDYESSEPYEIYNDYSYYSYSHPRLDISIPGFYNLKVKFVNQKMYWYYTITKFIRIR
jgi:hypothetical protein